MASQPPQTFTHDPSTGDFTVSKSAYLRANPSFPSLIATSALVLHRTPSSEPRILLLQRAPTDSNPNKWEPPGGAVDDEDLSIVHGAARELWEETGLRAVRIGGPVGVPHVFARSNGDAVCRFYFAVKVEGGEEEGIEVKLDAREHQNALWATENEARDGKVGTTELVFVGKEVRTNLLAAFGHVWSE